MEAEEPSQGQASFDVIQLIKSAEKQNGLLKEAIMKLATYQATLDKLREDHERLKSKVEESMGSNSQVFGLSHPKTVSIPASSIDTTAGSQPTFGGPIVHERPRVFSERDQRLLQTFRNIRNTCQVIINEVFIPPVIFGPS